MTMNIEHSGALLIALAIVGHAWVTRIQGPPQVVNAAGWVVSLLVLLVLLIALVR